MHVDGILEHIVGEILSFAQVAAFNGQGACRGVPSRAVCPAAVGLVEVFLVEHFVALVGNLDVVERGRLVGLGVMVLACTDETIAELIVEARVARVDEHEICVTGLAKIGIGMVSVVADDNPCDEPVSGIQRHRASAFLLKQDAAYTPVVGTKQRAVAVHADVELPHTNAAAIALPAGKGNTCTDGIDLEFHFNRVVISDSVTPRLHACHCDKQHEKNFLFHN